MSKYEILQDFQNNACSAVTLGLVSNSASRVLKYRTKIRYFFLYMLLANLITLFLLIYHLFNRSDYGLLKKKLVLGKVEN